MVKTLRIFPKGNAETVERCCGRRDDQHCADQEHISQEDERERKEASILLHIRLFTTNHPDREGEMEHPGESDCAVEPDRIQTALISKDPLQSSPSQNSHCRIEREEIRRKRDQEIISVRQDVPAF